jgi:hypothetical protein
MRESSEKWGMGVARLSVFFHEFSPRAKKGDRRCIILPEKVAFIAQQATI